MRASAACIIRTSARSWRLSSAITRATRRFALWTRCSWACVRRVSATCSRACCIRRRRRIATCCRRGERNWESSTVWCAFRWALKTSTTSSRTSNRHSAHDHDCGKSISGDSRAWRSRLPLRMLRLVTRPLHSGAQDRERDLSDLQRARRERQTKPLPDHARRTAARRTLRARTQSGSCRLLSFASGFAGGAVAIRPRARLAHVFIHRRFDERGRSAGSLFMGAGARSFAFQPGGNPMSVTITIPAPLRQFAGGQSQIAVEAKTAGEALDLLTSEHSALRRHLFNDQNTLRNFVNVYLNDEDIRHASGPDTPVKDGDTIMIVPSIAGGAV